MSRQRLVQDAGLAVLFASLAYVVLFWHLGAASFWDPDEAHYAETSQEMVATSDWWAPHYNEQPFFDKPALFHQLQAIAMVEFGPTEFAARIVPALAALGLILWLSFPCASIRRKNLCGNPRRSVCRACF